MSTRRSGSLLPPPWGEGAASRTVIDRRNAPKDRRDEAESGGDAAFRCGHNLMQGAASEAAVRQVGIDCRQAEGQGFARLSHPGQQAAQLRHHRGAVARHGSDGRRIWLCKAHVVESSWDIHLDIHCMFSPRLIEQNRNHAKAGIKTGIVQTVIISEYQLFVRPGQKSRRFPFFARGRKKE